MGYSLDYQDVIAPAIDRYENYWQDELEDIQTGLFKDRRRVADGMAILEAKKAGKPFLEQASGYWNYYRKYLFDGKYARPVTGRVESGEQPILYLSFDVRYLTRSEKKHQNQNTCKYDSVTVGKGELKPGYYVVKFLLKKAVFYIMGMDFDELKRALMAVLLENGIMKYPIFVFFNGDPQMKDVIDTALAYCNKVFCIDFAHLLEECYVALHKGLVNEEVESLDASDNEEDQSTTLDVLYSQMLSRILFVGNVDVAIEYLKHFDPAHVKDGAIIRSLCDYLDSVRGMIPNYCLRNMFDLPITLHTIEEEENAVLSHGDKDAEYKNNMINENILSLQALFLNHQEHEWFYNHHLDFRLYDTVKKKRINPSDL